MSSIEPLSPANTGVATGSPGDDTSRLHQLGYAQELARHMSGFSNFAVSFTIISILSGALTLYGFGLNTGGPAVIIWGWPIVGLMTLLVGLSMAEVCSSYPTAGGLYYWSAKLAKQHGPAWSWFTGWFNFLGQVAVTAGIDFGAAFFLNALLDLQFAQHLLLHQLLAQPQPEPDHGRLRWVVGTTYAQADAVPAHLLRVTGGDHGVPPCAAASATAR